LKLKFQTVAEKTASLTGLLYFAAPGISSFKAKYCPRVTWQKAESLWANYSFAFPRWQHRTDGLAAICNCMFWLGVRPAKSPLPWGPGTPSNTMCHWTPQMYLPNGI